MTASLLVHLRMTGSLLMDADPESPYTRARFELDDGHVLTYVDPRRFGTAHLMLSTAARDEYLQARLGAEPFTPEFTAEYLRDQARGRTGARQVLHPRPAAHRRCRQHLRRRGSAPRESASAAPGREPHAGAVASAQGRRSKQALAAGIDAKGASIDDFRHVDGARGSFQDRFLVHTRAGEPCPTCGSTIRKLVVGGRGTYVCETCQPRPRIRRASA